jgi:hypothetical protein
MIRKTVPDTRFSAKPTIAQGMNSLHALIGTRLKNPSRRRSKKPATPTTIVRHQTSRQRKQLLEASKRDALANEDA